MFAVEGGYLCSYGGALGRGEGVRVLDFVERHVLGEGECETGSGY